MTLTLNDRALAVLAHELRHPLAPIRTAVAVIRRLDLSEPRLTWALEVLDRQTLWLAQLVEGLGDLARLDTEARHLHWETLELSEIVETALALCQPILAQAHHAVHVVRPEVSAHVQGNRTRLVQVLVNLLSNAAKYTGPEGRITAEIQVSETEVSVAIRDTGRGIAPEVLPQLFEWFVRGDPADPQTPGWGVGLAVVKRLVEWHQGRVEAFSAGVGQGAVFTVHLPREGP